MRRKLNSSSIRNISITSGDLHEERIEMTSAFELYPYDRPDIEAILLDNDSPERLYIRQEQREILSCKYKDLSDEAKQIINIVVNTPQEIAEIFFTPKGHPSFTKGEIYKRCLKRMLNRQWKDRLYVKKVIREIEDFVRLF